MKVIPRDGAGPRTGPTWRGQEARTGEAGERAEAGETLVFHGEQLTSNMQNWAQEGVEGTELATGNVSWHPGEHQSAQLRGGPSGAPHRDWQGVATGQPLPRVWACECGGGPCYARPSAWLSEDRKLACAVGVLSHGRLTPAWRGPRRE